MAGRRFSPLRLVLLLGAIFAIGYFSWVQVSQALRNITHSSSKTWFGPYVDVTLTPAFAFEDPLTSPSKSAVLGFVVADPDQTCTPSWGTYYDLDGAGRALDLDRRIERLRQRGGDVAVSFGGAANRELAVACRDRSELVGAYWSVIDRYRLRTIDLDIEGDDLENRTANQRRAQALVELQRRARRADRPLAVWLTLPVAPDGLPRAAVRVMDEMLDAGVELAGVNVMTMNYGGSRPAGQNMAAASESALRATHAQMATSFQRAGLHVNAADLWSRIGATPMIGVNDVEGDVFELSDARALTAFAEDVELGRMSMWSANRDQGCGAEGRGRLSATCSGVAQKPLDFSWELGRLDAPMPTPTPPLKASGSVAGRDDPRLSPYPLWNASAEYARGDKVVWHGMVYEAKWYAQGKAPDSPVAHPWDSPWRYVGPILESDSSTPASERRWSPDEVYLKGDKVRHGGFIYQAKWWTQDNEPQVDPDRPENEPWILIARAPKEKVTIGPALPAWSGSRTYAPGSKVTHDGRSFNATAWSTNVAPDPAAARSPWREIPSP